MWEMCYIDYKIIMNLESKFVGINHSMTAMKTREVRPQFAILGVLELELEQEKMVLIKK